MEESADGFCCVQPSAPSFLFFFFNDTATTEIYTLSLHDALPIYRQAQMPAVVLCKAICSQTRISVESCSSFVAEKLDRKSTRLNSSHGYISYAVFCLKKKNRSCTV